MKKQKIELYQNPIDVMEITIKNRQACQFSNDESMEINRL